MDASVDKTDQTEKAGQVEQTAVRCAVDRETHVAVVTFDRPPTNSLDIALTQGVLDAYREAEREGAQAIVLRSEGRVFCSGTDPGALPTMSFAGSQPHIYDVAVQLFDQPLPVVAAVKGAAVALGWGWRSAPTSEWRRRGRGSPRTSPSSGCTRVSVSPSPCQRWWGRRSRWTCC